MRQIHKLRRINRDLEKRTKEMKELAAGDMLAIGALSIQNGGRVRIEKRSLEVTPREMRLERYDEPDGSIVFTAPQFYERAAAAGETEV